MTTKWVSPSRVREVMNLQFEEHDVQNRPDMFGLLSKYTMPCGHVIQQTFVSHRCDTEQEQEKCRQKCKDALEYVLRDRIEWHDCARVTPETPSGNIPFKERQGRTPPYAYLWDEK